MRKKEGNKQEAILEAAIVVFAQQGFHKAKISRIADEAGVAVGSVYLYFKNKEEILLNIFDNIWKRLYEEINELSINKNLNPDKIITKIMDLFFDILSDNPAKTLVFINEQNHLLQNNFNNFTPYYEKFWSKAEKIFNEGKKQNIFNKDLNYLVFRFYIFGALRNLLHGWVQNPKKFPLLTIRKNVINLVSNGILVKK